MKPRLLIISPHLDDAALSCGDHILTLKNDYAITVLNVFTHFKSVRLPHYTKTYIHNSGYPSVSMFELARKEEDVFAMKKMGIKAINLDFVDGGFRIHHHQPIYKTKQQLFSGSISPLDSLLFQNLIKQLRNYASFDFVLTPLGIGRHADHILSRLASEHLWPTQSIWYYADMPYALHAREWIKKSVLIKLIGKISYKALTDRKKSILSSYKSQLPLLFANNLISCPEIICKPLIK